jgi:hypothetical protein
MTSRPRSLLTAAAIGALLFCLNQDAPAFELFPRPQQPYPQTQYTVQRGDSLESLAGKFYGNPELWNFLWNQNPSIRKQPGSPRPESESLVPGTSVDVYHRRFPFTVMNQTYTAPTGIPEEVRFMVSKVPFKGIPYDRKYFRYRLGIRRAQIWGYIADSPDPIKVSYLERDLVYIRFRPSKRQCILVGDRFGICRERGPLPHPLDPERKVGYFAEVVGEVEVTNTGHELVTAIILDSYVEIYRGDKISLFVPREKEIVPTKTHRLLTGTIIRPASQTSDIPEFDPGSLENDVMFVDRGEADGMTEGMLLNIYRPSRPVQDPYFWRRISTPDRHIGEAMVLKPFHKNSTVIITKSREEVFAGDIIKSVSD